MTTPPPHPYQEHESHDAWLVLQEAVADLVDNDDLEELTHRDYIVGYLIDRLRRQGVLAEHSDADALVASVA